jgi:hypothetical protein
MRWNFKMIGFLMSGFCTLLCALMCFPLLLFVPAMVRHFSGLFHDLADEAERNLRDHPGRSK